MTGHLAGKNALFILLMLALSFSSRDTIGTPSTIEVEIEVSVPPEIIPNQFNETRLVVTGSFYVTEKSGLDQALDTDAQLTVSGDPWESSISPQIVESVQQENFYEFGITIIIPSGVTTGETGGYTVSVRFTNRLGTTDPETRSFSFRIGSLPGNGEDDDDNTTSPSPTGSSFPYWIVFVGGLVVLIAIGVIWAVRNVEIVKDSKGDRRIMLKERGGDSEPDDKEGRG